jgi:uncharacterized membrane protein YfcA
MLGYALAFLIGLSLGVLGGGGSILTVPIFVYVMGYPAKQAIAMSLPVVGATSLLGAVGHWRAGNFDVRAALMFGAFAMVGAQLGALAAARLAGVIQLSLLAVVMVVAAIFMLRPRPGDAGVRAPATGTGERLAAFAATAGVGLGVGVLTGLVGIGGGFLFVPALVLFGHLAVKTAIGTSLFVIAASTAAAYLGYRTQVRVPWDVIIVFTSIALVGLVVGTRLVRRLSPQALRRLFAYFLFLMAAFILYQNRGVLADPGAALRPSNAGAR